MAIQFNIADQLRNLRIDTINRLSGEESTNRRTVPRAKLSNPQGSPADSFASLMFESPSNYPLYTIHSLYPFSFGYSVFAHIFAHT